MHQPTSGLRPPFVHLVVSSMIPRCVGSRTRSCTAWWIVGPPPQGPSLGSGLFCPGPSSLNRPHPPHSQAHCDFAAERLIRNAFAVRERLGDPRVVPSFRCTFRPGMPSSSDPGELDTNLSRSPGADIGLRRVRTGSALPTIPQSVSRGGSFRGFTGSLSRYGLSGCSPPCTDLAGSPQPSGAFTSRLPTGRSPFPLLDMTTTVTGLLCWRDSHPLERQLASLHPNRDPTQRNDQ
jgi:hypothetical protein